MRTTFTTCLALAISCAVSTLAFAQSSIDNVFDPELNRPTVPLETPTVEPFSVLLNRGEINQVRVPSTNSNLNAGAVQERQKPDNSLNAEAVRRSIRFAVGFLKNKQRQNGSWPEIGGNEGGVTALVTLALVNAGEPVDSPRILTALEYLEGLRREKTYCVALRVMAMTAADPKGERYKAIVSDDIDWLLGAQLQSGGWGYDNRQGNFRGGDASNSQFAILALHGAAEMGIKIPDANWRNAKTYWEEMRNLGGPSDGAFRYSEPGASGSMTCAGIASTIIIRERLLDANAAINGELAKCCEVDNDDTVEKAFNWLSQNYTVRTNPKTWRNADRNSHLYYLYALERAGRFSGRRFIGEHDWYRDGAKFLLERQLDSGAWQGSQGLKEDNQLVATSYCLLFLSKGKRPVAIGKFDHGVADWDLHPQGVHYLTRRLETEWKQKMNWQTVKADGASVDDLFQAPVLFMSGQDAIGLNAIQKQTLKKYIENGGFLFAEACRGDGCADGKYDSAFRKLMIELFPESKLEPLDSAHPIWSAHFPILPSPERPLLGLQACCRTSVVYCPANLSCYWALSKPAILDSNQVPIAMRRRVEYATQIGVNVVAYATGRELNEIGETPTVADLEVRALEDRALVFPKLNHGGGADDAPNAWNKVLEELKTGIGLEIKTAKKMISAKPEALMDHPFIFIHGRQQISFTQEERDALRRYLELGGFIFADSICASEAFSESFREEMKKIIGAPLGKIPAGHDLWTNPDYGAPLTQVTLRTRDASVEGGFRESRQAPDMEGVEMDGRLAVIFSPFDLSCALENKKVSNCDGYTRIDALQIAAKVVLYSLRADIRK